MMFAMKLERKKETLSQMSSTRFERSKLLFFWKFKQKVVGDSCLACACGAHKQHRNQMMQKCVQKERLFRRLVSLNKKICDLCIENQIENIFML